ncbi:hypothetical protein [Verrucomicrobium sp. BvORR034]|uniref:hypothetical protein n=1 Tax=Verrucomicrobium sp. BvORR034 TaxID=1396418 RepID=UPI000678537E|nr:hypothetical protein [Verrucomicrobium sp. BvORR034]
MKKSGKKVTTPSIQGQALMNLGSVLEKEIDGIGMGVMPDGSAYLTARGLARMCGIDHTIVLDLANNWESSQFKPRGTKIANLLQDQGYEASSLFVEVDANGSRHHAFPDAVCMAFLEYYAFDSGAQVQPSVKEHALKNYRLLARSSLRVFIYTQVGYDPNHKIPDVWREFHDRVSAAYNSVPDGCFSVFKEISDMVVTMIQSGVPVNEKTVPDISVGKTWANFWADRCLEKLHGERIRYEHNYPDYFPQAASNPQESWAYPEGALGLFRKWMREVYFSEKFPAYITGQAKKHGLPPSIATLAIDAVKPKALRDSE